MSLRQRLLSILGALSVGVWLLVAVLTMITAQREAEQLFDAQLVQFARALAGGGTSTETMQIDDGQAVHPYATHVVYQVWSPAGELRHRGGDAPVTPMAGTIPGYGDVEIEGVLWRRLTVKTAGGDIIHVANRLSERSQLIAQTVRRALAPVLLAIPLVLAALWVGIRSCLWPLTAIASEIATRDADHLEPLRTRAVPKEVKPLVMEINTLLGRLNEAFGRFDRFAADAAHELRAPVTAIRAQAESGLSAPTDDERRHTLEQIMRAADTCGSLVEQILLLARLEPEGDFLLDGEIDLDALARDVMSDLAPRALAKGLDLSFQGNGPVYVHGNEELMRVLIRNLLDNAVRSTPGGGRVQLLVSSEPQGLHLFVVDTGPGIPERDRNRVLQRFCRLPDSVGSGYGIGLSIVQRIAEVHNATVLLEDGEQGAGLKVGVCFPT